MTTRRIVFKDRFYGQQISAEGLRKHRVDYGAFASAFNHVYVGGEIFGLFSDCWQIESGTYDYDDEIEELEEKIEEMETELDELLEADQDTTELEENIRKARRDLEELEEENGYEPDVYQWYIVDDNGAEICREFGEVLYYNLELNLYVWGVTHYGTAWNYVMTGIECDPDQD